MVNVSEITKLYENAGAELRKCSECNNNMDCGYGKGCYPPFTAEKQIELIKWLAINKEDFGIHYKDYDEEYRWVCGCEFNVEDYLRFNEDRTFEEALAGLINNLWQDLTPEEKQQIKEILE